MNRVKEKTYVALKHVQKLDIGSRQAADERTPHTTLVIREVLAEQLPTLSVRYDGGVIRVLDLVPRVSEQEGRAELEVRAVVPDHPEVSGM
jgi:hypothetical protein